MYAYATPKPQINLRNSVSIWKTRMENKMLVHRLRDMYSFFVNQFNFFIFYSFFFFFFCWFGTHAYVTTCTFIFRLIDYAHSQCARDIFTEHTKTHAHVFWWYATGQPRRCCCHFPNQILKSISLRHPFHSFFPTQ